MRIHDPRALRDVLDDTLGARIPARGARRDKHGQRVLLDRVRAQRAAIADLYRALGG